MSGYYGPDTQGMRETPDIHETVGAYALGILDDAEATAFEAHLAGCDFCAAQLDELAGMEPMLAALADLPQQPLRDPGAVRQVGEQLSTQPSPRLLDNLVGEVAQKRAMKRRRGFYLVAAAAALIIGGPLAVVAVNDGGGTTTPHAHSTSPAEDAFFHHMEKKFTATDADTDVTATVGVEKKGWGTHTVLELKNVKGPLKCSLIAVGKNGEEETVTSWAVPERGYGIEGSTDKWASNPLYVHGGAALEPEEIDRFEVRTFEGKKLVDVKA
ncbi:anti-sigma factor family protein [Streptomyces indicus]|uniref:Putative zinc-finger n=1 Tax=Streptomyces indicus TaxID=417292 RepID=A0A1G9DYA4_9ACTN|nr:zf-HC2 domain-containing protein [Streptomyces indicus]SDK68813.1 Putative zinc-finger [Streptomyces indicus]